tara:strand:+ start:577 stop:837 length:261 start_codon:yes stop_codon:yes gene_type:complete
MSNSNPINQKVFEGAAIRNPGSNRKVGTVGEKKKPKKGDTRNNGTERYTGTKWVKVDKVKEATKKAVKEAKKPGGREKGSVYVGNR